MDYNSLLDLSTELGYCLAMNGAETFRVEESIRRVLMAYGISAEVFAIPSCLHVSILNADGIPLTRMRRIGQHGNDLDSVERFSNLSRKICYEKPEPQTALQWLHDAKNAKKKYALPLNLIASFLGACGYCVLFGGTLIDSIFAGFCGILVGLINMLMDKNKANLFFRSITVSFLMALFAYATELIHPAQNTDAVIIGTLMMLAPGLLFINALRDIIYGDTNSGVNRIVQVFLIAVALSLGTGAAWTLAEGLLGVTDVNNQIAHNIWVEALFCFIGCAGFTVLFNIHGKGSILCAIGGMFTWIVYRFAYKLTNDNLASYFWATVFSALYAEIMARIRKYPAISYLVISAFPLIPGAGVYHTMKYAMAGDLTAFTQTGMQTLAIAGIMAVGILLISTVMRLINDRIQIKS